MIQYNGAVLVKSRRKKILNHFALTPLKKRLVRQCLGGTHKLNVLLSVSMQFTMAQI